MNFKPHPLLIAAGASLVIQLVLMGINTAVSVLYNRQPISSPLNSSETILTVIGEIACLGQFLVHALAGGLYSCLCTRREPFSARSGAIGGAAASALARLVGTPVYIFISLDLLYSLITGEKAQTIEEFRALPSPDGVILLIFGNLIVAIVAILIAAVLGAAGGAIVAAIIKRKTAPLSL